MDGALSGLGEKKMHCLLNTAPYCAPGLCGGREPQWAKQTQSPRPPELTGNYYVTLLSFVRGKYR